MFRSHQPFKRALIAALSCVAGFAPFATTADAAAAATSSAVRLSGTPSRPFPSIFTEAGPAGSTVFIRFDATIAFTGSRLLVDGALIIRQPDGTVVPFSALEERPLDYNHRELAVRVNVPVQPGAIVELMAGAVHSAPRSVGSMVIPAQPSLYGAAVAGPRTTPVSLYSASIVVNRPQACTLPLGPSLQLTGAQPGPIPAEVTVVRPSKIVAPLLTSVTVVAPSGSADSASIRVNLGRGAGQSTAGVIAAALNANSSAASYVTTSVVGSGWATVAPTSTAGVSPTNPCDAYIKATIMTTEAGAIWLCARAPQQPAYDSPYCRASGQSSTRSTIANNTIDYQLDHFYDPTWRQVGWTANSAFIVVADFGNNFAQQVTEVPITVQ
jgi:hypothetical protein